MTDDADADAHVHVHAETQALGVTGMPSAVPGALPPASAASDVGAMRLEHYTVVTREDGSAWELGRGAMGITYKAFDTRLHCPVALKVIHAALLEKQPALRERFLQEARIAARVRHPNIASVFHLGEAADGQCFYAMELIEGETLAELVRRRGPLPAAEALDIALQVASALVAAGQADMVHRDLKPANIMLARGSQFSGRPATAVPGGNGSGPGRVLPRPGESSESSGSVKVIDFGLARSITAGAGDDQPFTVVGYFMGTPAYASPEQLTGERESVDSRSDIFSLGSTLWYLLTGRLVYGGSSPEEIYRQQLRSLPKSQLKAANVPAPVRVLLEDMLAFDPKDRPQTPQDLLAALRRCREQILPLASSVAVAAVPRGRNRRSAGFKAAAVALAAALALLAALGANRWLGRARPPAAAVPPPAAPVVPEKSIAVLPFDNLSTDKDNAFFTDGVQDEILTDLARMADLKVISRTSVIQYKDAAKRTNVREIAQALGVAYIVEGSVQRAGNTIRVTAQLIDARTDTHHWAERYDRPLDDVFAIQSDIAQAIALQLQVQLSPGEKSAIIKPPTADFQAYDLYLRAQTLYATSTAATTGRENSNQAIHLLEEVLQRDPKFLLAWCLLARINSTFYFQGVDPTPARREQVHAAVDAALRLQPDAGEVHVALADYYYHGFRNYERALAELDIARRTLPNSAEIFEYSAYIDRRLGRWDEALHNMRRALELDPRNFILYQQMATTCISMHRFDDEARALDHALTIVPGDPYTRVLRAIVELDARANVKPYQVTVAALLKEDPNCGPDVDDPSLALCERTPEAAARALTNYPKEGAGNNGINTPHAFWEGVVARWERDAPRAKAAFTAARAEVEKVVAEQPDLPAAVSLLGVIDAGLGRKAEAIAEGRRACELLPISKDGIDGPVIADNLAQIYAWTGEKQAAIDLLEVIERKPNLDTYGYLKLHPIYDDLRGDPRFEALVASMAPKK